MKFLLAQSSPTHRSQRIRTIEEFFDCWYPVDELVCRLDVARTLIQERRDDWENRAVAMVADLNPTKHGIAVWLGWLETSNVPIEVIK